MGRAFAAEHGSQVARGALQPRMGGEWVGEARRPGVDWDLVQTEMEGPEPGQRQQGWGGDRWVMRWIQGWHIPCSLWGYGTRGSWLTVGSMARCRGHTAWSRRKL